MQCKSILTKSKLPEVDYCINPYVGCAHGCIYCYARFMKRFTNHTEEWGQFVDVKINATKILSKELSHNPKKGIILLGSVTDVYQPIEKQYKITRNILKVLLEYNFPISILTKSDLVLRDIDLLKDFNECEVGLTITSLDSNISKNFEPYASLPQDRLKALSVMHNSGIKTYAFIGPVLPKITDLKSIFAIIQDKVDFVMVESLNTRCGNWDNILVLIKKKYPHLLSFYQSKFSKEYWDQIELEVNQLSKEFDINLKGFYRH